MATIAMPALMRCNAMRAIEQQLVNTYQTVVANLPTNSALYIQCVHVEQIHVLAYVFQPCACTRTASAQECPDFYCTS